MTLDYIIIDGDGSGRTLTIIKSNIVIFAKCN